MSKYTRDSPEWEQEPKTVPYANFVSSSQKQEPVTPRSKVCVYARYSSKMQNSATIDSQVSAARKYCETNNFEIVQIYVDEAISGGSELRPSYRRMLADCKTGQFSAIVTYKLDRVSRKLAEHFRLNEYLSEYNIKILAVEGGFDDENPEGWLSNLFQMGLSEFYIRNLRRDTLRGQTESALKCKHTGGKPPLGFKVGADLHLEIDEDGDRADSAQKIFQWAAEGRTYKWIADKLNSMGRKNAYERPFNDFFLDMLRNEKYRGVYTWQLASPKDKPGRRFKRKERDDGKAIKIEGGCPRLISDELFFKVQKQLRHKQRTNLEAERKYLLTGFLRCACGYALSDGCKSAGKKKVPYYFYMCCSPRSENRDYKCYNNNVSMSLLNEFVIETIRNLVHNPERLIRSINSALEADGKKERVVFQDIQSKLSEFQTEVRKSAMDVWKKIIKRLVREIRVSREDVEIYLRLNEFFKYDSYNDLLCLFTKDRLSLRKIKFYTRKNIKENQEDENNKTI